MNKDEDENHDENDEFESDDFEEEFEFEGDEDALEPEKLEALETPEKPTAKRNSSKGLLLPVVFGLLIVGFLGYKAYSMFLGPEKPQVASATKQKKPTPPPEDDVPPPPTKKVEQARNSFDIEPRGLPEIDDQPKPKMDDPFADSKYAQEEINLPEPKQELPDLEQQNFSFDNRSEEQPTNEVSQGFPSLPPAPGASKSDIEEIKQNLADQDSAQQKRINHLENELEGAAQHITDLTKGMGALQQDVAEMAATVQKLAEEVTELNQREKIRISQQKAKQSKQRSQRSQSEISKKSQDFSTPTLSIHAIIPGRAWLRTQDGRTVTVTEGDPIGKYGKVLKIDAGSGMVVTTSGVAIR